MSHPEPPFDPRPGGRPHQEHSPPAVDPQAQADFPPHSYGYPPPPPVDPQPPVNYPDYSQPYPPPPMGYPESGPGYPQPPGLFPPPYPAGPPDYSGAPGYPGYSGYPGPAPYAGYPDPYNRYRPMHTPGTNSLAIGSLVASIGGFPLLFACYIGVAAWIAGIALGIVALNQIKQTNQDGRALAIAGITVGVVGLVIAALAAMLLLAAFSTRTY